MSYQCELCGKGIIRQKSGIHKHSGLWYRRAPKTIRLWKPNLKNVKIMVEGQIKKMRICTQCLKSSKVVEKSAN